MATFFDSIAKPYLAIFRTQSKAYGGAIVAKMPHHKC